MGNKIFYVYAIREDNLDSCAEAFLNLPASPYEMLDATDKLRLDHGGSAKFGIEEFYRFGSLVPYLSEKYDLCELNALAQKLSELDDQQETAFEGLLQMAVHKKEEPIDLPSLINMAYSTDCCHVVGEVLNDAQLGRFCAENGFVPGTEKMPDSLFDLLDFERIGREHRQREGGILVERSPDHPGGYVEQSDTLVEAYKALDLSVKAPDYTILLEASNGRTLTLQDVSWQTDNTGSLDGYALGDRYTAVATYTGSATSSYVKGYTVTADYTGTVSRIALNKTRYVAIFEGTPLLPVEPEEPAIEAPDIPEPAPAASSFNWAYLLVPLGLIAAAGGGIGIALFLKRKNELADGGGEA